MLYLMVDLKGFRFDYNHDGRQLTSKSRCREPRSTSQQEQRGRESIIFKHLDPLVEIDHKWSQLASKMENKLVYHRRREHQKACPTRPCPDEGHQYSQELPLERRENLRGTEDFRMHPRARLFSMLFNLLNQQ
jgi:hypothetical protein